MKRLMNHYHGSYEKLPVGTVLRGRGEEYQSQWYDGFYTLVNSLKPEGKIAQHEAVFMTGVSALRPKSEQDEAIQDIDNCGGACDYASRVLPLGKVEAHDMTWLTQAQELFDFDSGMTEKMKNLIHRYWSGEMSADPLIEYLTTSSEVLESDTFESLEGAGRIKNNDRDVFLVSRWQLENDFVDTSVQKALKDTPAEFDRFVVEAIETMGELSISAGLPLVHETRSFGEAIGPVSEVSVSVANAYIKGLTKPKVDRQASPQP